MTAVTAFLSPDAATVAPSREPRATDITKVHVPMPFMVTLVLIAMGGAAGVWRIESKVSVIETSMAYERQMATERMQRENERDADYRRYIDQRFETLEAKLESAGLRNAALSMSQEIAKQKAR